MNIKEKAVELLNSYDEELRVNQLYDVYYNTDWEIELVDAGMAPHYIDNPIEFGQIETDEDGEVTWTDDKEGFHFQIYQLVGSYYDNGIHSLEFEIDGEKHFVDIEGEKLENEDYWEDQDNIDRALENGRI